MGRLTLNVVLSFAQFEREVAGERIRDKIALSKRRGMWMGGLPPLGYDGIDHQLVVNKAEADMVRFIFQISGERVHHRFAVLARCRGGRFQAEALRRWS